MAAIVEVLGAVKTVLEARGLSVELDRQEDDAISPNEGEVVALSWQGADASTPINCDSYFWTAQLAIEVWANVTSVATPLERITANLALIAGAFDSDRTFGGKFHDSYITAVSGLDDLTGDRGTVTVTATVQFWTSRADITSIATD